MFFGSVCEFMMQVRSVCNRCKAFVSKLHMCLQSNLPCACYVFLFNCECIVCVVFVDMLTVIALCCC
ncbi:Protein of unknown function [Gryllus bimaculatus]|nr:Protein of unknown function [Gryllus bimaculatus]